MRALSKKVLVLCSVALAACAEPDDGVAGNESDLIGDSAASILAPYQAKPIQVGRSENGGPCAMRVIDFFGTPALDFSTSKSELPESGRFGHYYASKDFKVAWFKRKMTFELDGPLCEADCGRLVTVDYSKDKKITKITNSLDGMVEGTCAF